MSQMSSPRMLWATSNFQVYDPGEDRCLFVCVLSQPGTGPVPLDADGSERVRSMVYGAIGNVSQSIPIIDHTLRMLLGDDGLELQPTAPEHLRFIPRRGAGTVSPTTETENDCQEAPTP